MSGYLRAKSLCQSDALPESVEVFHGMEVPDLPAELLSLWKQDVEFLRGKMWDQMNREYDPRFAASTE